MNNLMSNRSLTMSSRDIAAVVNSRHDSVKRTMERLSDKDVISITPLVEPQENGGKPVTSYLVNKRNSYIVVAQISPEFTAVLVDRWQELENKLQPTLPQSFAQALQLAADQAAQLELAAPKIAFHDTVVNDDKTFSIRDAAKKIQQRPNKFSGWLRDNNYVCLNNMPAQRYIDQGLFVTHTGQSKQEHQFNQCRVTSKGCAYFANKLSGTNL